MRTITLHKQPIITGIVILVSVLMVFGLVWSSIGFFTFSEQGEKVTTWCNWDLLQGEQTCKYRNYFLDVAGFALLMAFFNFVWFSFLFVWLNNEYKWVQVKWVD